MISPDTSLLRPKIRPRLGAQQQGEQVLLYDPMRVGLSVQISRLAVEVVVRLDGTRTLEQIQTEVASIARSSTVPLQALKDLVSALDEALLLESPRLEAELNDPIRKPSCVGAYSDKPDLLREQLHTLFTAPGGPGLPGPTRAAPEGRLRAVLVPHMDYGRGNITYGWGFHELAVANEAKLFVIIGTSHYSANVFSLTRKQFQTPFGTVETDQGYVDRLERAYGPGLFADPFAHLPEHSIELEVVLLQYLYADRFPIKIVPLLVGSFDRSERGVSDPSDSPEIQRMVSALRQAEAESAEPVCYIISGDLAHIGPKFNDPEPVREPILGASRIQDDALLRSVAAADLHKYQEIIVDEQNRRRICGYPPTWLTLEAVRPKGGRILHYQQYVEPSGHESVSFAAAALYD